MGDLNWFLFLKFHIELSEKWVSQKNKLSYSTKVHGLENVCKDMHAKAAMPVLLQNVLKEMRPYDKNKYSLYFSDAKSLDILLLPPKGEIWKAKLMAQLVSWKGETDILEILPCGLEWATQEDKRHRENQKGFLSFVF